MVCTYSYLIRSYEKMWLTMKKNPSLMQSKRLSMFRFLLMAIVLCFAATVSAREIAPLKYPLDKKLPGLYVPYACSHDLSKPLPQIKRVMLAVHSSSFDANAYLENGIAAAKKVRGAVEETCIVAPHFLTKDVVPGGTIPDKMLHWKVSPFRGSQLAAQGPRSLSIKLSAYELIDEMLAKLTNRKLFPNLRHVVMVGHSAGGQLVQRYALIGKFEPPRNVEIRFVVCAPSSYAYVNNERLVPGSTNKFAVPADDVLKDCGNYNHWGYGLEKPYAYFRDSDPAKLRERYGRRQVYYLCGEKDTNGNDGTTSRTCGAMTQGDNRRERAEVFYKYVQHVYGRSIRGRHKLAITPGVGHSGRGNMTSAMGVKFLFSEKP